MNFRRIPTGYKKECKRNLSFTIRHLPNIKKYRTCSLCNKKIPNKSYALKINKKNRYWENYNINICAHCLKEISDIANIKQHDKQIPIMIAEQI